MARTLAAQPEQRSPTIVSRTYGDKTETLASDLDRTTRWGLWALPVWAVLLFVGTIDHQPDTNTDFGGFARYVTTPEFLASHIVASIIGAAIGVLGLLALFTFLALRVRSRLAVAGLTMAVTGNVMLTAVFGLAAFGQVAVGRLYLAGQTDSAVTTYKEMYGAPLAGTAAAGILLLVFGITALGIVIARSGALPRWVGIGVPLSIVAFGVVGAILNDFVQSIGAALLIGTTLWLALSAWRAPAQ
jgi:hypothetical protein